MIDSNLESSHVVSPFNSGIGQMKYKACVGDNGGYDQETIYESFSSAVEILLKSIANITMGMWMHWCILFSIV